MKKTASSDALERALTDLHQTDIPAGYQAAWRDAVKREELSHMKSFNAFSSLKRAALPVAAALVLIVGTLITGALSPTTTTSTQSAGSGADYDDETAVYSSVSNTIAYDEMDYEYEESVALVYEASSSSKSSVSTTDSAALSDTDDESDDRKIIRTVELTISSTTFDEDYETILSLMDTAGGYAASVNVYEYKVSERSATLSLKIPSESLDDFLSGVDEVGRVTNRYESTVDATTEYNDTEMRLETQQAKLERLEELLAQAETVTDLLEIESEIADTQYEIDSLESSLLSIDRQVSYSTVYIYLDEETPATTAAAVDLTLGERMINGLKASLDAIGNFFANMVVFLTAIAPVLVPLVIVIIVVRLLVKRRHSDKNS